MIEKKWKLINFCELDKFAIKSYCAIHNENENKNLGDITKVDETKLESFNVICGGSPCQDFSIAGGKKGSIWTCKDCGYEYNPLTVYWEKRDECPHCESKNLEKTRSSLLVEYLRVVRANKPNFGLYENVKNIVGKQFKDTTFKLFVNELEKYGYNVYWRVLNAKDYGIPQNRERVYLIFIKKELDNGHFRYPYPFDSTKKIEDFLEDDQKIDKKFFISDEKNQKFITDWNKKIQNETYTIDTKSGIKQLGNIVDTGNWDNPQRGRIYSPNGCAPALNCCGGGGLVPKIIRVNNMEPFDTWQTFNDTLKIRQLTPKECFRLMGFSDSDFSTVEGKLSNTQLYKQAGNSIVVDVLYYILLELYKAMPYLFDDLRLNSLFSGIGAFETALDKLYEYIGG